MSESAGGSAIFSLKRPEVIMREQKEKFERREDDLRSKYKKGVATRNEEKELAILSFGNFANKLLFPDFVVCYEA